MAKKKFHARSAVKGPPRPTTPLMPPGMMAPQQQDIGPIPNPRITLEFDGHDEYVRWVALHRATGTDMAEARLRQTLIGAIQSVTQEEAIAIGGYLREAILAGWEGEALMQARQAMGFICGLNAAPWTPEAPAGGEGAEEPPAAATGAGPVPPDVPNGAILSGQGPVGGAPPPAAAPPPRGPAPVPGGAPHA
jgi:hypothetical protein